MSSNKNKVVQLKSDDADRKKSGGKPRDESKKRGSDKLRKALLSCVAVIALVVVSVIAILAVEGGGSTGIKRMLTYISVSRDQNGLAEQFSFAEHSKNCYGSYRSGLVVASVGGINYYDKNGNEVLTTPILLTNPAIKTGKTAAVVYDIGGTALAMFNTKGIVFETEMEKNILAASINDSGYLAVVTEAPSAKAQVTVYNPTGELVFAYYSSSSYITGAVVSPDNVFVSCVTTGQSGDIYESKIVTYSLDSDVQFSAYTVCDDVVLDIGYIGGDTMCIITDSAAYFGNLYEALATYDYSDKYLRDFTITPDGYVTFLLNKYRAGSRATVVTVDDKANTLGSIEYAEEVLSISAAGGYVAVLANEYLKIFNSDMGVYSQHDNISSAKRVIIREDATALLIGSDNAWIYIP